MPPVDQSDAWVQLSADILGRLFIRSRVHEAGAWALPSWRVLARSVPSLHSGVEAMVRLNSALSPILPGSACDEER
jgi:sugar (pentulose or hexulose) kinase